MRYIDQTIETIQTPILKPILKSKIRKPSQNTKLPYIVQYKKKSCCIKNEMNMYMYYSRKNQLHQIRNEMRNNNLNSIKKWWQGDRDNNLGNLYYGLKKHRFSYKFLISFYNSSYFFLIHIEVYAWLHFYFTHQFSYKQIIFLQFLHFLDTQVYALSHFQFKHYWFSYKYFHFVFTILHFFDTRVGRTSCSFVYGFFILILIFYSYLYTG